MSKSICIVILIYFFGGINSVYSKGFIRNNDKNSVLKNTDLYVIGGIALLSVVAIQCIKRYDIEIPKNNIGLFGVPLFSSLGLFGLLNKKELTSYKYIIPAVLEATSLGLCVIAKNNMDGLVAENYYELVLAQLSLYSFLTPLFFPETPIKEDPIKKIDVQVDPQYNSSEEDQVQKNIKDVAVDNTEINRSIFKFESSQEEIKEETINSAYLPSGIEDKFNNTPYLPTDNFNFEMILNKEDEFGSVLGTKKNTEQKIETSFEPKVKPESGNEFESDDNLYRTTGEGSNFFPQNASVGVYNVSKKEIEEKISCSPPSGFFPTTQNEISYNRYEEKTNQGEERVSVPKEKKIPLVSNCESKMVEAIEKNECQKMLNNNNFEFHQKPVSAKTKDPENDINNQNKKEYLLEDDDLFDKEKKKQVKRFLRDNEAMDSNYNIYQNMYIFYLACIQRQGIDDILKNALLLKSLNTIISYKSLLDLCQENQIDENEFLQMFTVVS